MSETFLIGTSAQHNNAGIYSTQLDPCQGILTPATRIIELDQPTNLVLWKQQICYAAYQNDHFQGIATIELTPSPTMPSTTTQLTIPSTLVIDDSRDLLISGHDATGSVTVFHIGVSGQLTQTDSVVHQGLPGPLQEQNMSYIKGCSLTPDNQLTVCDSGMDLTVIYHISDEGTLLAKSRYQSSDGFGPHTIQFHPDGQTAYLIGDFQNKIEVLRYVAETAQLEKIQTVATVPPEWPGHNRVTAILVSQDGHYVYATNAGHNTIVVFKILSNGTLESIQQISTLGELPQDLSFSQNDHYLICINQLTNDLTLFNRCANDGKLSLQQSHVACPAGTCIRHY